MSSVPIALDPNKKPFYSVNNLSVPCEGPRTFPVICNWGVAPSYSLDLQNTEALKRLSMVQSVFIDNSLNDQSVSVLSVITGMTLTIKAGQQGNLNIDVPNPAQFVFSSTGTLKTKFQIQNFPVTNEVWDSFNPGGSGSAFRIATVTLTGAQLAAINSTPITAIAAQGTGKKISPASTVVADSQFTVGTTPYTTYGSLFLKTRYESSELNFLGVSNLLNSALGTDNSSTQYFGVEFASGVKSSFDNKGLQFIGDPSSTGRITASNVTAGNAGMLYAPGDTFTVNTGDVDAAGVVDTVGVGGDVLTFHLSAQGTLYSVAGGNATTATSGAGTGLQIDITAIQSVADGDGTLTLTIPYIVGEFTVAN